MQMTTADALSQSSAQPQQPNPSFSTLSNATPFDPFTDFDDSQATNFQPAANLLSDETNGAVPLGSTVLPTEHFHTAPSHPRLIPQDSPESDSRRNYSARGFQHGSSSSSNLSPFAAFDVTRTIRAHIQKRSDVLRGHDLHNHCYKLDEAIVTIDEFSNRALKDMIKLSYEAEDSGSLDQARWMYSRLQTAINEQEQMAHKEKTGILLRIANFHRTSEDVSRADRTAQMLMKLGSWDAVSESSPAALFMEYMEKTFEKVSVDLDIADNIFPPLHRLLDQSSHAFLELFPRYAPLLSSPPSDFVKSTLLHLAAEKGDETVLEYLLGCNETYPHLQFNIDSRDDFGRTPMYIAVSHGHESAFLFLRQRKARSDVRDAVGHSLLTMAARGNHVSIGKHLLADGFKANEKPSLYGYCPLIAAAERGCKEFVGLLLQNGADRSVRKIPKNRTAAELAHENGFPETAELINQAG